MTFQQSTLPTDLIAKPPRELIDVDYGVVGYIHPGDIVVDPDMLMWVRADIPIYRHIPAKWEARAVIVRRVDGGVEIDLRLLPEWKFMVRDTEIPPSLRDRYFPAMLTTIDAE